MKKGCWGIIGPPVEGIGLSGHRTWVLGEPWITQTVGMTLLMIVIVGSSRKQIDKTMFIIQNTLLPYHETYM